MKRDMFFCYNVLSGIDYVDPDRSKLDAASVPGDFLEDDTKRIYLNDLLSEGYIVKAPHLDEGIDPKLFQHFRITWKGLRFIEVYEQCEEMKKHASSTFEKMLCDAIVLQL